MSMGFPDPWPALRGTVGLSVLLLLVPMILLADEEDSRKPKDWEEQLEMLRAVPYIDLTETIADETQAGVTFYDGEKCCNGYNLYCARSSSEAFLVDMEGQVVHRWARTSVGASEFYDNARMLNNGDLLVITEYDKLLRLKWNSELIWERELTAHHDVTQAPDNSFYLLAREYHSHNGMRVKFDAIVHLTEDGEEIDRWSTYDHLAEIKSVLDTRSFLDTILDSALSTQWSGAQKSGDVKKATAPQRDGISRFHVHLISDPLQKGQKLTEVRKEMALRLGGLDYFHMNTVSVIPATALGEKEPRFQSGNLLVCFRNVNQIAVLEKETYRILWAWGEGELEWPHRPTLLESGHILIFDNGVEREYSRVVELDPVTDSIVWEYKAQPPELFFTYGGGSAQRLPNGNTLICETNKGRVFEVTGEGEMVWLWLNPSIRRNRRETISKMTRLSMARVDALLKGCWSWWWWE